MPGSAPASLLWAAVLLLAAAQALASVKCDERTPVGFHGALRAEGSKILGKHGNPVRLRGMSMFWSQWMGQFWNEEAVRWLVEDWHVTVIRAAMGVEMDGYLDNQDPEQAKLEAVVDACISVGIYVIIDWHDHRANTHLEQAKDFFARMAEKYGRYRNVIFETWNEPEDDGWSEVIKAYHEQVVSVIREHTDNLIILGTRTWSQEVDTAASDPVQGANLAYSIHFYAASMGQALRDRVASALDRGFAVFATEWGTCEYTGDGRLGIDETNAWLAFFAERSISDANWAIDDKEESCAALTPGASGQGGWSEDQLTESGRFVRDSLRREPRPWLDEPCGIGRLDLDVGDVTSEHAPYAGTAPRPTTRQPTTAPPMEPSPGVAVEAVKPATAVRVPAPILATAAPTSAPTAEAAPTSAAQLEAGSGTFIAWAPEAALEVMPDAGGAVLDPVKGALAEGEAPSRASMTLSKLTETRTSSSAISEATEPELGASASPHSHLRGGSRRWTTFGGIGWQTALESAVGLFTLVSVAAFIWFSFKASRGEAALEGADRDPTSHSTGGATEDARPGRPSLDRLSPVRESQRSVQRLQEEAVQAHPLGALPSRRHPLLRFSGITRLSL